MAADVTEGTLAHGEPNAEGGLPQMNVDTFASQLFWLVLTFGILMIVMNRFAIPNISGAIVRRQGQIQGDLASAEELQQQATESLKAYESSLASARSRALALADENRKQVIDEVQKQQDEAEKAAQASMAKAETRIAAMLKSAEDSVLASARDATIEIVERLMGETVQEQDVERVMSDGR